MAWYLNRSGQTEGPYEDDQIVSLIRYGQLRQAQICAVGASEWMPLHAHSAFAQAVQSADPANPFPAAPPAGAGAPPTAVTVPASAPLPTTHAALPAPPIRAAAARSKKLSAVAIVVIAISAVVAVAGATGLFLLLRSAGPKLGDYLPRNVDMLLEIPSVRKGLGSLSGVTIVDREKLDDKKVTDDFLKGLADAFELTKDDAKDLAGALDSFGIAGRFGRAGRPEGAFVYAFGSAAPVEKLLASKRFTSEGAFSDSGKRYTLKSKDGGLADASTVTRVFGRLSSATKDSLVWFEKKKLLVSGSTALVSDVAGVLESGHESLAKSKAYQAAKAQFASGASMFLFLDPSGLIELSQGGADNKIAAGFFKNGDPITATAKLVDSGLLIQARGKLSGDYVPNEKLFASASGLTLAKKLPSQTVGYWAFSTKMGLSGSESIDELDRLLRKFDKRSAEKFRAGLDRIEEQLGLPVSSVVDSFGEQGVYGLVAASDWEVKITEGMDKIAFVYAQQVKDKGVAEKLVAKMRDKLFDGPLKSAYKVTPDGAGFIAESTDKPLPKMQTKFLGDTVVFVVGASDLVARTLEAMADGKDVLGDDPAYKRTIKALSDDVHAQLYVDAGRLIDRVMKDHPDFEKSVSRELGIAPGFIRTTGAERVTFGATLRIKPSDGGFGLELDSVNLPIASAAGALPLLMRGAARKHAE